MQRENSIDRRVRVGLLAAITLTFSLAGRAEEPATPPAQASVAQAIEAARRQKAQDLDAAAQRLLGKEAVQDRGAAAKLPELPMAVPAAPVGSDVPMIWSLSGVGERLRAEILYQGQIITVTSAGASGVAIGPWSVRQVAIDRVELTRAKAGRHRRGQTEMEVMTLRTPERGAPLSRFAFADLPDEVAGEGAAPLAPSAVRASQLPTGWNAQEKPR